jgi:hypothetical protein
MQALDFLAPLAIVVGIALALHRRIAHFGQACLVAGACATLPGLLALDLAGAVKTGFMPFTLFVLFVFGLAGSAIVGLPFYMQRRRRGQAMQPIAVPRDISWAMIAGMLAVGMLAILVAGLLEALDTSRLMALVIGLCIGGPLAGAFGGTLFLGGAALAGHGKSLTRRQQFITGASLAAGFALLVPLPLLYVPAAWNQPPHGLTLALELNLVFFMPLLAGIAYGRRKARQTA